MDNNIYIQNGYNSRQDYLQSLADEYDLQIDTVLLAAEIMGESEDWDGLISMLQDAERMGL